MSFDMMIDDSGILFMEDEELARDNPCRNICCCSSNNNYKPSNMILVFYNKDSSSPLQQFTLEVENKYEFHIECPPENTNEDKEMNLFLEYRKIIIDAYASIVKTYRPNMKIWIFGDGESVRAIIYLIGMLSSCGIRRHISPRYKYDEVFHLYQVNSLPDYGPDGDHSKVYRLGSSHWLDYPVYFVGIMEDLSTSEPIDFTTEMEEFRFVTRKLCQMVPEKRQYRMWEFQNQKSPLSSDWYPIPKNISMIECLKSHVTKIQSAFST